MPFHLQLPRLLYDRMLAQALEELPNECCGLLAGAFEQPTDPAERNPIRIAVEYFPLRNAAASPREYLSDARSMFDAVRRMSELKLDILAVFHSHPTSEAVPSRTDLDRNYSEQIMNLILCLKPPAPVMRGWWLRPDGFEEAQWSLI